MKYYRVQVQGVWTNHTSMASVKAKIKGADKIAIIERIIIDGGDEITGRNGRIITKTLPQMRNDSLFKEIYKDDIKFMQRIMKARIK